MIMVMNPWIPNHLNNFSCSIKVSCHSFSALLMMRYDSFGNVASDRLVY